MLKKFEATQGFAAASRSCALFICAIFGLGGLLAAPVSAQVEKGPAFSLPTKGGQIVVRLVESIDGIESDEPGPTTTVYADGRVVVERPSYMKRAGRHETRLSPEALRVWLGALLETGISEFDAERSRGDKASADRARRLKRVGRVGTEVFARSSASRVDFELRVDVFRSPAKASGPSEEVRKKIEWRGLRGDVRRYPELEDLRGLDAAVGMTRLLSQQSIAEAIDAAQ